MLFFRFTRPRNRPAAFRPRVESLPARDLPSLVSDPPVIPAGGSIQAAIDAAPAGATILIQPGTYREAVTVDKPGLHLIGRFGKGAVVIENPKPGTADNGITVTANGAGFTLANVTVRDFGANGVFLAGVNGFRLTRVRAVNNHDYGLFPALSQHGVIAFSSASGSHDTGIYVGQSADVSVRSCTAHDNVNGFEVENSTGVRLTGNLAFHNTVGIFEDLLPPVEDITVTTASHDTFAGNVVRGNNRPNDADPSDLAHAEQSGVGILLVGGDHMTVANNHVTGNNFGGIVLLSGTDLETLLGALPPGTYAAAHVDPTPEHTSIRDNDVVHNGLRPADPTLPHADLIASPSALAPGHDPHNHWAGNTFITSFPSPLP
jgi:parallel beta-helix repeat protein